MRQLVRPISFRVQKATEREREGSGGETKTGGCGEP